MEFERKILDRSALLTALAGLPRPLVFTNGCFDILHRGHVDYLARARALGACLVVGVNTDESVLRLGKGDGRPFNKFEDRAAILAALESVTVVTPFDEDTPLELILLLRPDHLVKGGDWDPADIVGNSEVTSWGGDVHSISFRHERSTSTLVEIIRDSSE